MKYNIISFYRYTKIDDSIALIDEIRSYCKEHHILGRILIGKEGINGACSGKTKVMTQFKQYLQAKFNDLTFREQPYHEHSYHKLVVRERDEICAFGQEVNLENKGTYIEPAQLQQMYENNDDFIIVDARNDYEYDVGRFKNAIKLPIKTFREFPKEIQKHQDWKNKKVVLYCTGGIRCEKASAYMKEQGFHDVNHVKGGIINYVNQFPNTQWEGGLFVFDDRLVSDVGQDITQCQHCSTSEKQFYNCHNLDCDKLFICCKECNQKFNTCCSQNCKEAPRQREGTKKPQFVIGKVENYYPKAGVALVKVNDELTVGDTISIKGKTTHLEQQISEMRDYDGNVIDCAKDALITIPVNDVVRKNDCVLSC